MIQTIVSGTCSVRSREYEEAEPEVPEQEPEP